MKQIYPLLRRLLVLIALCLGAAVAARADTVVLQTEFLAPGTTLDTTYPVGSNVGQPDSFRVAQGSVVIPGVSIDPNSPCNRAGATNPAIQCLLLPALGGTVPLIISNKSFGPGDYLVNLSLGGGPAVTEILAQFAGDPNLITVSANTPFTNYQFISTIQVGTSAELQINGGGGVLINSITVTQLDTTQTPVPEPATMVLFGTGLAGVAARVRRRRRPRL